MTHKKTARGIVIKEDAILLIERWRKMSNGHTLHYFSVPGGSIEKGESPESAVVRELFEEASIIVRPICVVAVQTGADDEHTYEHTYFACDYLSGMPRVGDSAPEIKEAGNRLRPLWVQRSQLATTPLYSIYEPLRPLIEQLFNHQLPVRPVVIK